MPESAYVHLAGEGRVLDMGSFAMTVKADAERTGGAFTLLEADEPPGFGPPLHVHEDVAEAFYVLAGEYVVFIGEDEHRCPAGSFVYVPAGVEHGFRVGRELAAANATGTSLGEEELAVMAARYGVRVLGPVPEGYL